MWISNYLPNRTTIVKLWFGFLQLLSSNSSVGEARPITPDLASNALSKNPQTADLSVPNLPQTNVINTKFDSYLKEQEQEFDYFTLFQQSPLESSKIFQDLMKDYIEKVRTKRSDNRKALQSRDTAAFVKDLPPCDPYNPWPPCSHPPVIPPLPSTKAPVSKKPDIVITCNTQQNCIFFNVPLHSNSKDYPIVLVSDEEQITTLNCNQDPKLMAWLHTMGGRKYSESRDKILSTLKSCTTVNNDPTISDAHHSHTVKNPPPNSVLASCNSANCQLTDLQYQDFEGPIKVILRVQGQQETIFRCESNWNQYILLNRNIPTDRFRQGLIAAGCKNTSTDNSVGGITNTRNHQNTELAANNDPIPQYVATTVKNNHPEASVYSDHHNNFTPASDEVANTTNSALYYLCFLLLVPVGIIIWRLVLYCHHQRGEQEQGDRLDGAALTSRPKISLPIPRMSDTPTAHEPENPNLPTKLSSRPRGQFGHSFSVVMPEEEPQEHEGEHDPQLPPPTSPFAYCCTQKEFLNKPYKHTISIHLLPRSGATL
ncbi:hypothetical protein [Candidatus Tisiphia endosymbiont of Nemotelus uliginosus]|uniref:hypothetical protein n=1 Tax=Candidatus Tisiphia endosymbiont of Nemotelus uliginosus TaxID=3077926 RepID=UPI0035C8BCEC